MELKIKVLNTEDTNKGKYNQLEVTYRDLNNGKTTSKKVMSFTAKEVYTSLKSAPIGSEWFVVSEKEGEYWQWKAVRPADATESQAYQEAVAGKPSGSKSTPAPKSTYETPEERAARQRLIVRQSSLTAAVGILTVGAKKVDAEEVKSLAEELCAWVFETEKPKALAAGVVTSVEDLTEDIPL